MGLTLSAKFHFRKRLSGAFLFLTTQKTTNKLSVASIEWLTTYDFFMCCDLTQPACHTNGTAYPLVGQELELLRRIDFAAELLARNEIDAFTHQFAGGAIEKFGLNHQVGLATVDAGTSAGGFKDG